MITVGFVSCQIFSQLPWTSAVRVAEQKYSLGTSAHRQGSSKFKHHFTVLCVECWRIFPPRTEGCTFFFPSLISIGFSISEISRCTVLSSCMYWLTSSLVYLLVCTETFALCWLVCFLIWFVWCRVSGHPLAQNEKCLHMFLQDANIDKNYVPGKVKSNWGDISFIVDPLSLTDGLPFTSVHLPRLVLKSVSHLVPKYCPWDIYLCLPPPPFTIPCPLLWPRLA